MGKTTYSQKLAYDWANKQDEWDESFPSIEVLLLLRCNDIKSGIWEAIDDQLLPDDIDKQAKDNFFRYIRENQANVLLLLDGLDEAESCKLDLYLSLVQSKLLPDCHIVITSRHEVGKKVRPYCDTLWEIVGFCKEDAESFIRKYFKGKKEDLAEKLIERLILPEYSTGDPLETLGELTRNPLNTALLCCLFEDSGGVFSASRTQLYVEIVLFVLRRYEEKNGLTSNSEDLTSVYREEILLLGIHALKSLLKMELYFEEKEDIVKSINFGLLSLQQGGTRSKPFTRCAFAHKSFQEFFAGFNLAFQIINKETDCASVVADERYLNQLREVFLFMSGIIALQSHDTAETLILSITGHINALLRTFGSELKVKLYLNLVCEFLSECAGFNESLASRLVCTLGGHLNMSSVTKADLAFCRLRYAGAAAISQMLRANSSLTNLDLSMTSVGVTGAVAISQALTVNSSLTGLFLGLNSIGDAGASYLSQALTINSSMSYLDLSKNNFGVVGASCLSRALTINFSLNVLILCNNNIGDAGTSSLSRALTVNSSLTSLDLSYNSVSKPGACSLANALTANSSLTYLGLSGNSIGDAGASCFSHALTANSSLTYLGLSGNSIGDAGASCFSHALTANSSLTHLNFRNNGIGDAGASCFSRALTANSSLTCLDLTNNSIGDAGASCFAHALTANSSLTALHLTNNSIGDAGASCFSRALTARSSLSSLDLTYNSIGDADASSLSQALTVNSLLVIRV